jgi:predicted esterase
VRYTLYIPSGILPEKKYPVFIAFDPSGNGGLPVAMYQDIAERYRFVLMGSENSRNGQQAADFHRIASAMMNEASSRFQADSSRLYLLGFSGGARVSSLIGLYLTKVQGVVACGAGFPGIDAQPSYTFDFYCLSGDRDFNLTELIDLDRDLENAGWDHKLEIFPGGHHWPDTLSMEHGIDWILGNRIAEPGIKQDFDKIYGTEKEKRYRQEMIRNLYTPDTLWWKSRIANLKEEVRSGKAQDTLMARRLLGFVGMMAYSRSSAALQGNDPEQMLRLLTVYRYVEPENPAVDSLFRIYSHKTSVIHGK